MVNTIFQITKTMFGDTVIWDGSREGFYRSIPMSINDWECLKAALKRNIENYKRWPSKYTAKGQDKFGFSTRDINFNKLFEDIYGDSWYFDDIDLVQGDRTIVSITKDMTYLQMCEAIESSTKLIRK